MLSLGSSQEVIESQRESGTLQFDIGVYLQNVVLANIASPGEGKKVFSMKKQ